MCKQASAQLGYFLFTNYSRHLFQTFARLLTLGTKAETQMDMRTIVPSLSGDISITEDVETDSRSMYRVEEHGYVGRAESGTANI